jgi:hypothetical protein
VLLVQIFPAWIAQRILEVLGWTDEVVEIAEKPFIAVEFPVERRILAMELPQSSIAKLQVGAWAVPNGSIVHPVESRLVKQVVDSVPGFYKFHELLPGNAAHIQPLESMST